MKKRNRYSSSNHGIASRSFVVPWINQTGELKYFPPVHRWEMSVVVEADDKGRILLPIEVRRKFKAKRYRLTTKEDRLELQPLVSLKELKGKYKDTIRAEWDELEEKGEDLVSTGKR